MSALFVPFALLAMPSATMVAVVVAPGRDTADLARIIAEADGAIVNAGGSDNVILAHSDSHGFVSRLYAAGAHLVLNADLAKGCGPAAVRAAAIRTEALPR
ncbi:DNA-binding NarL/FixJ family response regulator [Methylobacterium sp. BE186]|uniref:hypothetical protein n=1 Tax=Methylobacterium sp. BE186 TaxID=2817715 RepID=UPI002861930E|nr:hypothetical protein [Methylobacterium sp. BE186]MDR7039387.1 DNA-binding NarL/FixJ family response regulator [Methylobacterium sp. BE186]